MNLEITRPISREDWLRTLRADNADAETTERIEKDLSFAEQLIFAEASPKAVYKIFNIDEVPLDGFSIKKHLEGCHSVAIMAITLGAGIDELIRKMQIKDMAMAVLIDSGASVLADQLCDDFQGIITDSSTEYNTSRFSPGYGDYPISLQPNIVRMVDGQRKIGLNVTKNNIMVPRKSVTALIGIADHPVTGRLATCGECVLREKCTLRKEGKFCGD